MYKTTLYLTEKQKVFLDECKENGITNNWIFNRAMDEFMENHQEQLFKFNLKKEGKGNGTDVC
jgi:hypothetical protein